MPLNRHNSGFSVVFLALYPRRVFLSGFSRAVTAAIALTFLTLFCFGQSTVSIRWRTLELGIIKWSIFKYRTIIAPDTLNNECTGRFSSSFKWVRQVRHAASGRITRCDRHTVLSGVVSKKCLGPTQ